MPAKFQSAVHKREDITFVKLSGVIDEDNSLDPLSEQVPSGTLVIDLSEIERINSCGVRDWVNWLGKVEKQGSKVVMVECSPAIVAQVNLVNNFTGQGVVKSFYAPYFCPQCDREKVLLIETRDAVGARPFHPPSCRCDECDGPMDFDDMEDSYFAFLGNTAKIVTDARVDEVVTEFTPSDGGPKLRTKNGHSQPNVPAVTPSSPGSLGSQGNPGSQGSMVGSLPSVPSLPSLKKMAAENFSAVSTGRHLLTPVPAVQTGRFGRPSVGEAAYKTTALEAPAIFTTAQQPASAAPAAQKAWFLLLGVLMIAALGLCAYFFLGNAEGGASSGSSAPK